MKAEPLKDKIQEHISPNTDFEICDDFEYLDIEDVKAAVEWLRYQLQNNGKHIKLFNFSQKQRERLYWVIKKAFPDLYTKKK